MALPLTPTPAQVAAAMQAYEECLPPDVEPLFYRRVDAMREALRAAARELKEATECATQNELATK